LPVRPLAIRISVALGEVDATLAGEQPAADAGHDQQRDWKPKLRAT
jgi:hypothetical protein